MRHEDGVVSAVFNVDNHHIVTASYDKTARVWDSETGKPLGDPLWHDQLVSLALFSPDGRQIATASEDGAVRVWELFDPDKRFAEGAADLAECVGGTKLNETGVPEPIGSTQFEKLRVTFSSADAGAASDPVIKWFLSDRSSRTIAPSLVISTSSYVRRRLDEGSAASLEEAYRSDPGNPLVVASLAEESDDPERALFYSRYTQAHAGNNAEVWGRLAQALRKHGKTKEALAAIDRALALQPGESNYAKFRALLVGPGAH